MKKGDKIVCIREAGGYLTLNKVYIVNAVDRERHLSKLKIYVWDDRNQIDWYFSDRFIPEKKDVRKQKLKKINESWR